ncbi:MAG: hypothetical protein MPN21_15585 [Thermoanaerobaculia bacterium]|nr:hypothetical protein [Thermoanaerobaculia bacterium]
MNPTNLRGLGSAVAASVVLGAVSTFGDWIWARFLTDGAVLPGLVHGVVFFAVLALVLAAPCSDPKRALKFLLLTLPAAGLGLAAVFYPLAYAIGYLPSLLVTWAGMWLAMALLLRIAAGRDETPKLASLRAVLAAVGSGLAFWAVSDLWTGGEMSYLGRLWRWTVAFLPGMTLLQVWRSPPK